MRIVSLHPSATEIVCGIGLRSQLVGVTHECDFPVDVQQLPRVTKTLIPVDVSSREIDQLVRERLVTEKALYSLDMQVLQSLKPDVIVTQALCDVCAVAESEVKAAACSLPGNPQVINLEPTSLADVFECIRMVGSAAACALQANRYIEELQRRVTQISNRSSQLQDRPRVMMLEWIDPPFCAGHWSPELVHLAGGREVIGKPQQRSVQVDWSDIVAADPEVLMMACCGYGVDRTLQDLDILRGFPNWNSLSCVKSGRVYVVDGGAYFSRPGPRLVDSLEILANALHPDLHPLPIGLVAAHRINC